MSETTSSTPKTLLPIISFIGWISGLIGGVLVMAKPGEDLLVMQETMPALMAVPLASIFSTSIFWVGVAMLVFLFLPQAVAFAQLMRRSPSANTMNIVAGVLLALWFLIGVIYGGAFWSWLFLILGIVQIILAAYDKSKNSPSRA